MALRPKNYLNNYPFFLQCLELVDMTSDRSKKSKKTPCPAAEPDRKSCVF